MAKVGRNDLCPCGSKQKYKHCHLRLEEGRPERQSDLDNARTLQDRNIALVNAATDIFELYKPWESVKLKISPAQVREFYAFVSALWPQSTDLLSLLPEPDSSLRALYLGEYAPELIVQNVCRFGLYADEIVLINPFEDPNIITEEHNPLVHPEGWLEDTLRVIFQIAAMAPWIAKGFVKFIPNPTNFDSDLRSKTYKAASERLASKPLSRKDIDASIIKRQTQQKLLSSPPEYLARTYKQMNPEATEEEVQNLLNFVEQQRKADPFQTGETMDKMPSQYMAARSGANLETGLYLCQAIGSFPYTNYAYRWEEILSARAQFDPAMETWTPLTKAFQELDFKFLDSVDPKFAYQMREDGRLNSFRTYLRKVWKSVDGSPDPSKWGELSRDFSEELKDSYQQAKKEWSDIDIELIKWIGGGGMFSAGVAGIQYSMTPGKLSLSLPVAGFALSSVTQLISSRLKRRNFRKTTPMSLFIDLEKHKH